MFMVGIVYAFSCTLHLCCISFSASHPPNSAVLLLPPALPAPQEHTISASTHHHRNDLNIYEGWQVRGLVEPINDIRIQTEEKNVFLFFRAHAF